MGSSFKPNDPYYPNILYYMPSINRFADHQWFIVHDLITIFDRWQLTAWIDRGRDAVMQARNGMDVMIYYLTDEEEYEIFDFLGFQESFGVKVERQLY